MRGFVTAHLQESAPLSDRPSQNTGSTTVGSPVRPRTEWVASSPLHLPAGTLGVWKSTAICGNDVTSSCFYSTGLCAAEAGPFAPLAMLLVGAVLHLFRKIYGEVCSALPLNGGAYNVLLNTTTKAKASVAACLSILAYLATAVINAEECMRYALHLWPHLDVLRGTVALLVGFAVLNLIGIGEAGAVAVGAFVLHIATLTLLVFVSAFAVLHDGSTLVMNWHLPTPHSLLPALFFGFAVAMLGVSGFETSANFIEEQRPGVFPKTLRNMWLAVMVFNPLISLLAMGLLPMKDIVANQDDLLAEMGHLAGGAWLHRAVSLDAVLVLACGVLTSYVGITGLARRMSMDSCLPEFLTKQNRWRGTPHWITLLFLALCVSILAICSGRVEVLAGVYSISFLGVMGVFAVASALLKVKRADLRRDVRASWLAVVFGFLAMVAALAGNLWLNPTDAQIFALYMAVTLSVVSVMYYRVHLLKLVLIMSLAFIERAFRWNDRLTDWLIARIQQINHQEMIFFAKSDNLALLNHAALYVQQNEQSRHLKVVHCYKREEAIPSRLPANIAILNEAYPRLNTQLELIPGQFGPALVDELSERFQIPKNHMFIGTPDEHFPHSISELGGVRLIV